MNAPTMMIAALLTLVASVCMAKSLDALEDAEQKVIEVWDTMPVVFRQALFAAEEPTGFGGYIPRANSDFKKGEPLLIYSEPVGYGWRDNGNGSYVIDFGVDLIIRNNEGETVAKLDDFGRVTTTARSRAREFMLKVVLNVTGAPLGKYTVEVRARDLVGEQAGVFTLPFSIVDQ